MGLRPSPPAAAPLVTSPLLRTQSQAPMWPPWPRLTRRPSVLLPSPAPPHPLCSSHPGPLLAGSHTCRSPASGPLHMLFPLPGTPTSQMPHPFTSFRPLHPPAKGPPPHALSPTCGFRCWLVPPGDVWPPHPSPREGRAASSQQVCRAGRSSRTRVPVPSLVRKLAL